MKKYIRSKMGVTLVALVITIIILLILSGISISVVKNTKLFKKAQESVNITEKAEKKQEGLVNEYEYQLSENMSNKPKINADGKWNESKKVNNPKLMEGMTGVYWDKDGNEIEVTSENQDNWYDYSKKQWANAVTKDSSGNITGYWVWIPRYAYKIESGRYTSTAGKISIKFLQGTTNKDEKNEDISTTYPGITGETMSKFVVHPSFTDGSESGKNNNYMNGEWDEEIEGYWVAKYVAGFQECTQTIESNGTVTEPTINTANVRYSDKNYTVNSYSTNAISQNLTTLPKMSYPVFKPLTYAYNNISTGDAYTISQEISKARDFYGLNPNRTDSHQMKNSEWGAVAYLTQSIYGRNGEEITINSKSLDNSSKYIYAVTGYEKTTANGISASTTNNKSGIYDLVGCVWERTAAYISNGDENINTWGKSYANTITNEEGYKTFSTKYATAYPYDLNNKGLSYDSKKSITYGFGDAILETSARVAGLYSWNGEHGYFTYSKKPFFVRGGHYGTDSGAGVFGFANAVGTSQHYSGFRSILVAL